MGKAILIQFRLYTKNKIYPTYSPQTPGKDNLNRQRCMSIGEGCMTRKIYWKAAAVHAHTIVSFPATLPTWLGFSPAPDEGPMLTIHRSYTYWGQYWSNFPTSWLTCRLRSLMWRLNWQMCRSLSALSQRNRKCSWRWRWTDTIWRRSQSQVSWRMVRRKRGVLPDKELHHIAHPIPAHLLKGLAKVGNR